MNLHRSGNLTTLPLLTKRPSSGPQSIALNEESFHRMIALERKRTERSRNPFLLMLLETGDSLESDDHENLLSKALSTLSDSIRETDVSGWYKGGSVVGVMFTQLGSEDRTAIVSMMLARVSATLRTALGAEQFSQVSISFHLFPEDRTMKCQPSQQSCAVPRSVEAPSGKKILQRGQENDGRCRQRIGTGGFRSPVPRDRGRDQAVLHGARVLSAATDRAIRRAVCFPEIPFDVRQQRLQRPQEVRQGVDSRSGRAQTIEREWSRRLQADL